MQAPAASPHRGRASRHWSRSVKPQASASSSLFANVAQLVRDLSRSAACLFDASAATLAPDIKRR